MGSWRSSSGFGNEAKKDTVPQDAGGEQSAPGIHAGHARARLDAGANRHALGIEQATGASNHEGRRPMTTWKDIELAFRQAWPKLLIPGEFDSMDATDQERWRDVLLQAFAEGVRWAGVKDP